MNIWSTLRIVPPISPEALAWATLSFATYLAATEMRPVAFGVTLAPLVLAFVVQTLLQLTKNMMSQTFARAFSEVPANCLVLIAAAVTGLGAMILYASDADAALIFIGFILLNAILTFTCACYAPSRLHRIPSAWSMLKTGRVGAMKLQSAGMLVKGATLLFVWHFAGPLGFAAMMTFGVLLVHIFVNWIIVLYLLDLRERAADE